MITSSPTTQPIFLIEDEPDTADLVTLIVQEQGHQVVHAPDGQDALNKIASMRPPSLVLLDIQLPHADGITILKQLRTTPNWGDVPVILLTAVVDPRYINQAVSLKVRDYILKPFKRAILLRYVERALTPLARP